MIDLEEEWPAYPASPTPVVKTPPVQHPERWPSSQWRTAEAVEPDDEGDEDA